MKFSEWVKSDTVAIKTTAIYYGVPSHGHATCYKEIEHGPTEQVTSSEPDIATKLCSGCDKPLLYFVDTGSDAGYYGGSNLVVLHPPESEE